MANEYRIYKVAGEAISDGAPAVQISSVQAEAITDGVPDQSIRLYNIYTEVIRDLRDKFSPEHTENPESSVAEEFLYSEPFGWAPIGESLFDADQNPPAWAFRQLPFTIPDRERNPYPTHILAVDLDEQQRTLRDQHNRTQAGDSTFDYGLLLKPTPDRLYTLGSVGRFYHESFGIIVARYVRFKSCVDTVQQGAPCGYFSSSRQVDWVVTNDLSKSGKDQVVGVMCLAETPADDTYGWVVTEGPVPVVMTQSSGILPAPETPYVWSATGEVDIGVSGKILARRWGKATNPTLSGGSLFVRLEGMSPQWFTDLLNEELAETLETVQAHETRLDTVEGKVGVLEGGATTLTGRIATLTLRLGAEEAKRARDDAQIRTLLGATDWSIEILAASNALRAEFGAADEAFNVRLTSVESSVAAIQAALSSFNPTLIQEQIEGVTNAVTEINTRLNGFAIDLTGLADDQVLISTSTVVGALTVYTFEPIDFKLAALKDVDVTTSPPADGDMLVWDSTTLSWIPATPASGGGGGGSGLLGYAYSHTLAVGANSAAQEDVPGMSVTFTLASAGVIELEFNCVLGRASGATRLFVFIDGAKATQAFPADALYNSIGMAEHLNQLYSVKQIYSLAAGTHTVKLVTSAVSTVTPANYKDRCMTIRQLA